MACWLADSLLLQLLQLLTLLLKRRTPT